MEAQTSSYLGTQPSLTSAQDHFSSSNGPTSRYHVVNGAFTEAFGYFPTSKSEERTSLEQSAALIDPITKELLKAPYMSNCGCGSTLDLSTWKKLQEKGSKCVVCENVFTRLIYNTPLAEELSLPGSQRPVADRLEEFFKRRPIDTAHQMEIAQEAIQNLQPHTIGSQTQKSIRAVAFAALQEAFELSPTSAEEYQELSKQLFPSYKRKVVEEEEDSEKRSESSDSCGSKRKADVFSGKEKEIETQHKKSRKGKEKNKGKEVADDQAACKSKGAEERVKRSFPEILLHEVDVFSQIEEHFSGLSNVQVHCNKLVCILDNLINSYKFPKDFETNVKKPLSLLPQYGEFLTFELIREILSQINEGYKIYKSKYFNNRGI